MRRPWRIAGGILVAALVVLAAVFLLAWPTVRSGFSVHEEPGRMETMLAGKMRRWSVPADLRAMDNPVRLTPALLGEARAHFADHCATCHGNDGKGETVIGRRLYPRPPDMTLPATQTLADGELFAVIENGVRLSGMPGWGDGTAESRHGSWSLVHFVRHLPELTEAELAEMKALNPVSPEKLRSGAGEGEAAAESHTGHQH